MESKNAKTKTDITIEKHNIIEVSADKRSRLFFHSQIGESMDLFCSSFDELGCIFPLVAFSISFHVCLDCPSLPVRFSLVHLTCHIALESLIVDGALRATNCKRFQKLNPFQGSSTRWICRITRRRHSGYPVKPLQAFIHYFKCHQKNIST